MKATMLVHIHIPKNGGQSFNHILQTWFGPALLKVYDEIPGIFYSSERIREILVAHPTARALATHNMRYPLPPMPGIEYQYVTFLRDPIDRAISMYYYEKKTTTARGLSHYSQRPIAEWLERRLEEEPGPRNGVTNWQTFHLHASGNLDLAKQTLEQMLLPGVVEAYDASLVLLAHKLHLPLRALVHLRQNVTRHQRRRQDLDTAVLQRLRRLNEADIELHRFGLNLLHKELERMGRFYSFPARLLSLTNSVLYVQHRLRWSAHHRTRKLLSRLTHSSSGSAARF